MKRDIAQFERNDYDVLVIGGGISGAFIAWDAALRGLSVALIDKGDFGHATSANSLKTIHGGLRYLQDADLRLIRMMINERRAFLRIAPHLVHPLPCVMPTYRGVLRHKTAMAAALRINDLVGFDRNRSADPQKQLPRSRVISRDDCLRLLPGIADEGITGAAVWYDAQMYNSERLTLAVVQSAAEAGADVANYVEATAFLLDGTRVRGIRATDVLTGVDLEIRAHGVVNAAGPWVDRTLGLLTNGNHDRTFHVSTAMNLVTRQIIPHYAAGIRSRSTSNDTPGTATSRVLFIAPWRHYSLIGTVHAHATGDPDDAAVRDASVHAFIDEVNRAYPGAALTRDDVYLVHRGLLPAATAQHGDSVTLVRQGRIHDHDADHNIQGLITVVGVKYTTARQVAEQAVDLIFKKRGTPPPPCRTHVTPLHGGQIEQFDDFLRRAINTRPHGWSAGTIRHLVYTYGSAYLRVLKHLADSAGLGQPVCAGADVLNAEVYHAVQHEMAQTLADVIFRRTEFGSAGDPGDACLMRCATIMAPLLGWSEARIEHELAEVRAMFNRSSIGAVA